MVENNPKSNEDNSTNAYCRPSVAYEWYTKHTESNEERDVFKLCVASGIALVDSPDNSRYKEYDVDNLARVEWHAESVDKEQLEPSTYSDDAWHNAIENCRNENKRDDESYQ
ncbi:unknown [Prevotella sp. CAG:1092]|nr:unknown [Prevotella sp. CAG:1092]